MNIVFDFGVVLFDWQPAQFLASDLPEFADTPQAAQQLAHALFGHADWHAFDRGTLSMDEVVQRSAQRLALPHARLDQLIQRIGELLTPVAGTVGVLDQLVQRRAQGGALKLYFLSNMPVPYARELEQRHAFLTHFDGGIFSGDVQLIKPEPAIYALLESRYELDPAETLFIDDLKSNVLAAQGRGWQGLHFENPAQLGAALEHLL
jgi:putative hydrolase of the HAD superfamily